MSQACLGYLWMKGLDKEAAIDVPEWTCSLCLLRGGKIIHFDIDPRTDPKGKIPLAQAQAEASTGGVPGALYSAADCFRCVTPNRVFHIFAETHENRNKWVNLLTEHIQKLQKDPAAFKRSDQMNFQLKAQIATAERVEFLTKSGGIKNLSWKKRLFVLNGSHLVYYELPQGLRAKGNYGCYSCSSVSEPLKMPPELKQDHVIQVESDCGTLLLGAADMDDKRKWMDALMSRESSGGQSPLPSAPSQGLDESSAALIQKLSKEKEELEANLKNMSEMKEKSDKIIRALKNENKKLKNDVEELKAQLNEKDQGIKQLSETMERMRIEVMEAHDAKLRR